MRSDRLERFIRDHTAASAVPFVPEVTMLAAAEAIPLWEETEAATGQIGLPPPFWAFPWAGGQGLARYVLDHPAVVRGRGVLDLASGGGLVAIAAALAGAEPVTANEIDKYAAAAIALNAAANGVTVDAMIMDLLDTDVTADVILAGDVFYSRTTAQRMIAFLRRSVARSAGVVTVLAGDPGRAYAPPAGGDVTDVASYDVPVIRDLEGTDSKRVRVFRIG